MKDVSRTLDLVFGALADPSRRAMLARLSQGPATVGELAQPLEISKPAVSQHLKVLEAAGLVVRSVQAQWRSCTLRTEPLDEVSSWLDRQRAAWQESFDMLEYRLRDMTREQDTDNTTKGRPSDDRECEAN